MKSFVSLVVVIAITAISLVFLKPHIQHTISADQLVYVIDGDTAIFRIDGRKQTVRFVGVDTPEMKGRCAEESVRAEKARQFSLSALSQAQKISLVSIDRDKDKYDRLLRRVLVDGDDISDLLIRAKLGRQYTSAGRQSWC